MYFDIPGNGYKPNLLYYLYIFVSYLLSHKSLHLAINV